MHQALIVAKEQRKIIDKKLKVVYDDQTPNESAVEGLRDYCVEYLKESNKITGGDDSDDISGNISDSELDEMKLEKDQKSRLQFNADDRKRRLGTSTDKRNINRESLLSKRKNRNELTNTVKNLQKSIESQFRSNSGHRNMTRNPNLHLNDKMNST